MRPREVRLLSEAASTVSERIPSGRCEQNCGGPADRSPRVQCRNAEVAIIRQFSFLNRVIEAGIFFGHVRWNRQGSYQARPQTACLDPLFARA